MSTIIEKTNRLYFELKKIIYKCIFDYKIKKVHRELKTQTYDIKFFCDSHQCITRNIMKEVDRLYLEGKDRIIHERDEYHENMWCTIRHYRKCKTPWGVDYHGSMLPHTFQPSALDISNYMNRYR